MDYNNIIKYLYSLERKKGSRLGLENIKKLLKKINNPEKSLKCIHVAGTNGKGSVCAMISSVLQEAGYKVGMYTGPHLVDFRDRFLINNKKISKKDLVKCFLKVKEYIDEQTFFEVITAMAFFYFKGKVDFLVLEVGLGGRLDATNVVKPLVSVITTVDVEHTDFLGKSLEKIAYEKAGIIKKNVPVVTAAKNKPLSVIKKICKNRNSKLFINKGYKKSNGKFNVGNYKNLKLNLEGNFQLENASVAVTTIDVLNQHYKLKINEKNIKNGLNNIKWPGRFDFLKKNILVDCAHNPAALKVLTKELKLLKIKKLILVIGILNDKDIKKMVRMIEPFADKIIITRAENPRAEEPLKIKKFIKNKNKIKKINKDVKKAVKYAEKIAEKGDLILVTGSCFVVGETIRNTNI